MLDATEYWSKSVSEGKPVDVIYFDFAKAFDRVSHTKLLHKLCAFRIPELIIKWVESYLKDRTFKVRVGECVSSPRPILSGIPQGSVIGPLLFTLFTAEIPYLAQAEGVVARMYADDIKIYCGLPKQSSGKKLQDSINKICHWSTEWQLPLAENKCATLYLGKSNPKRIYYIGGTRIPEKKEVRDLGFIIDSDLKFSSHVRIISLKAKTASALILRALRTKSPKILIQAYKIYVRPILESGCTVFSPYLKGDIQTLENVQNYFTRRVYQRCLGKTRDTMPDSLTRNTELDLESLAWRRKSIDSRMLTNLVYGHVRISLKTPHHFHIRLSRCRGPGFMLSYPTKSQNYRMNSFFMRAARAFNNNSR